MIKNLLKILISVLLIVIIFIGYFAYFGITTSQFNSFIKEQFKKQNNNLDIDLKKVKLHLDLKNISIKIKTKNPNIIINNYDKVELNEITLNISISSYFQNKFSIKNLTINSKDNKISSYINFYIHSNNSLKLILLNQVLKQGTAKININLNFDEAGNIINDYNLSGKVSNAEIQIPKNITLTKLNFKFNVTDKNYKLEEILFKFNKINFNSEFLEIKEKNNKFLVKGNLKNKKNKINDDIIFLFFNDSLKNFDLSNSKFDSTSEFTFDFNKKYKIKNLKIQSSLNIDELFLKYDFYKIKNYVKNYDNLINLKENKFNIKYFDKKFIVDGSSEFYIDKNLKNLIQFQFEKSKKRMNFETFLNLENLDLVFEDFAYKKIKNDKATLKIKGFSDNKKLFFKHINYKEKNNKIEINNLEIKNNKILNIDKIKLDYFTINNFKNQINLIKKDINYELTGSSFDSIKLIENISNSETDRNFFEIFENLNSKVKISIQEVKLDDKSSVNDLNGNLVVKNNKIFDLDLNSNFTNNDKLFISIKTQKDNAVVTTFYSDRAKPFVKKYKFIKGFEGGNLDFSSKKINNISRSKLIIDNFKVQEVPVLAKLLTLASLQGIADLLTGEGVRFTDFEMIYSNKDSLMTIDEIYAIGPAISLMMEGYVESNKLISLRGTLVPATTINRTISSIPILGDFLVGKKVGEGVFGVSFKIKGPPKNLKTRVNPIKTLTPRFITRTLEKIKKN